ncbi:MAG: Ku protein [Actinobacteria bacterium]|nr:Ku protein [Actinomycetota bacterium]
MRAIWSGAISFGLVNIPVQLYTATGRMRLDFNYLHREDLSPIRYARVCRAEGLEIPFEDIVRGYEYQKGEYVVLDDEDFRRADVAKTFTIDIVSFTDEDGIESIYFEKPYYLEPDRGAAKPYALLREALRRSKKVGVAKFVLRNREHIGIIKPDENVIVLNQLRFMDEIRAPADLALPAPEEAEKREVELALSLIDKLSEPFKPEAYKDTYTEELMRVIEEKVQGKVPTLKGKEPEPTEVKDLMARLKASLEREERKAA